MSFFFYTNAAIAIGATFLAMVSRSPIHALLSFVLSLLALGLSMFELGAPFAAALELIIYAGAIMVLFVFVVMLLNPNRDLSRKSLLAPGILFAALLGELLWLAPKALKTPENAPSMSVVTTALFRDYGLLVELASFLLLAGLIAAYRIAKK